MVQYNSEAEESGMEDENRTVTDGQPATEAQDASPRVDDHPLKGPAPPADKNGKKTEKIKGVFSTQIIQKVGTGTTTRKTVKKSYWFVDEIDNNVIEIQPLNVNYVPSGPKRRIPKEDFLEKFSPEPEFYVSTVFPNMRKLNQNIKKGEEHREKGE
jgi:hypothetical protein